MLPRGDDTDEDDFPLQLFTRAYLPHVYRYPTYIHVHTIIYDIEVLLIRDLLNHFMKRKVETPTTLPHSSASIPTSHYIH